MAQIKIKANGKQLALDAGKNIEEFLKSLGMTPQRCVVELNGEAKKYADFKAVELSDGDVIEVMTIVAGG